MIASFFAGQTPGGLSRDFILWIYRRNNPGLTWSDLTGEYPQPIWRTELDLWYWSIKGEYESARLAAERAAKDKGLPGWQTRG